MRDLALDDVPMAAANGSRALEKSCLEHVLYGVFDRLGAEGNGGRGRGGGQLTI